MPSHRTARLRGRIFDWRAEECSQRAGARQCRLPRVFQDQPLLRPVDFGRLPRRRPGRTWRRPARMRVSDTIRREDLLARATLVLNRSWLPVHVTTVRRALCMVFRDAARIVCPETLATYDFGDWLERPLPAAAPTIRSPSIAIAAPEVVLLRRYDRVPRHEAPFTRRNLFLRDNYTCQYCGRRCTTDHLSVDHVQPRSRGGGTSWENCVLACVGCNARKADQTPREAGLRLLRQPTRPRWTPYLNLRPSQHMDSWARFSPQPRRRANRN